MNKDVLKQPVNLNMGCHDSVMKKRAELAAIWLSQFVGERVKLEFLQRYSDMRAPMIDVGLLCDADPQLTTR